MRGPIRYFWIEALENKVIYKWLSAVHGNGLLKVHFKQWWNTGERKYDGYEKEKDEPLYKDILGNRNNLLRFIKLYILLCKLSGNCKITGKKQSGKN